jgi:hypothetical protein
MINALIINTGVHKICRNYYPFTAGIAEQNPEERQ